MVFNDSIFATPKPSFERPVPLVLVDPWDEPLIYLKLNSQWMPYILGALRQLVLQSTWDTTDPAVLDLVQARAMSLINMFTLALQYPVIDDCCHEIAMTDSRVKWLPSNPFTSPNDVPPGYHFPPWYIAPTQTLLPGVRMGDLVTDLLHAPYNPLASGFPRLRMTVDGPGTIEIKFVRFPTASIALWTVDGNLSSTQWTDLHVTLEAAIGRFDPEMVIPIEVTGQGQHVVDISIIASISEEPPFVHFGGGIRSISLCGFGAQPAPKNPIIDEMEYQMSICEQLRWHNGRLQGLCCGEWTDISGQGDALLGGPDQQGGDAPRPQPGGGCQTYHAQFSAKSQYLVPVVVNSGDTIAFSNASGAGHDGSPNPWNCPNGQNFFAGACVGGGYTLPGDPAPTINHMGLIAQIGGVWYEAYSGTLTVPGGVSNSQIIIQVNDSDLADNSGSYALDVEVCNNASTNWESVMDLALNPYDFTESTPDGASSWVPASGWQAGDFFLSGNCYKTLSIRKDFTSANITHIEFQITSTLGYQSGSVSQQILYYAPARTVLHTSANVAGAQNVAWDGALTLTNIVFSGAVAWRDSVSDCSTIDGAETGLKCIVRGTGPKPPEFP